MGIKIISKNRRALYEYFLKEKFEAGIDLRGTEVKSLRLSKVELAQSYANIDKNNEVWLYNMNIPPYDFGNINNHSPIRKRKLLLHKKEISKISHQMDTLKLSLIVTMIYFKDSFVKIELALAQGKKLFDKREDKAKKDQEKKLKRGLYD